MNNGQYIIAMMRDIIGQYEGLEKQELKRMHFLLDMLETLIDFGLDLWAEGFLEMNMQAEAQGEGVTDADKLDGAMP